MKKFSSLLLAGMLLFAISASASQVILNSRTGYEINIDGRVYNNGVGQTAITDLYQGAHTVNVYQVVSNGVFGIGKKRNLISTQQFNLGASDVYIDVDQNGQVRINQNGYGNNNQNRNGGYNNNNNNGGYDNRGNSPGNSAWGHQQGKKKGHYKNKKNKHDREDDGDDDRYERNDNRRENN
ncbi:MAG: hypothetical protein ABIY51_07040 [Ferruginibacter sp.]